MYVELAIAPKYQLFSYRCSFRLYSELWVLHFLKNKAKGTLKTGDPCFHKKKNDIIVIVQTLQICILEYCFINVERGIMKEIK